MKYKNVVRLPAMALLTAALVSGCAMTPEADSSADRADRDQGTPLHVSCKTNMTPEHRVELEAIDSMMEKDRKSTRLNSSHVRISYAVFCLKKKKINQTKS